jgi:hypothetical protein
MNQVHLHIPTAYLWVDPTIAIITTILDEPTTYSKSTQLTLYVDRLHNNC